MAATPRISRRTRTTDPASRITLRLGKELIAFLTAEAGEQGLAKTEYVRNLIARGLHARQLDDTTAEIRAAIAELRKPSPTGSDDTTLEVLLEVRAMLRMIATARDPMIVTNARKQALEELTMLRARS